MKWAFALLCLILVAPLTLVDVPPLLDYPNHLARAVVLASAETDPILSSMYRPRWAIIPDLGVDLVLPPLLHVLPVHWAGRIVVGLSLLLPIVGVVAYSRATFGTWSAWPMASALVAYNATFLLGFLNFVAGIGMALLLGAAWIAWRDRYPKLIAIIAAVGTVVLFFCHLMGVLFFYVLISGYELERLWVARRKTDIVIGRIGIMLPMIAAPLMLYLVSPLALLSNSIEWTSAVDKLRQLVLPFANYVLLSDIVTAGVVAGFLLACIITGRCRLTPAGGVALAVTTIGFVIAPWACKGTYFFDTRFVILLGYLLFAAVRPIRLTRLATISATCLFAMLFATRMGVIGYAWHGHQRDVADLRAVISSMPPGARVMVTEVTPTAAPEYWRRAPLSRMLSVGLELDTHLPALLLIEHRAYWPFLFDNPSQQPVETRAPYKQLAEQADRVTDYRALDDLCGYDYLLLLDAGGEPDLAHFTDDRLALVAQRDIAALFRVKQTDACFSRTEEIFNRARWGAGVQASTARRHACEAMHGDCHLGRLHHRGNSFQDHSTVDHEWLIL